MRPRHPLEVRNDRIARQHDISIGSSVTASVISFKSESFMLLGRVALKQMLTRYDLLSGPALISTATFAAALNHRCERNMLQQLQNEILRAVARGASFRMVAEQLCQQAQQLAPDVVCTIVTRRCRGAALDLGGPERAGLLLPRHRRLADRTGRRVVRNRGLLRRAPSRSKASRPIRSGAPTRTTRSRSD